MNNTKTILIVDDEPVNLAVISKILSPEYTVQAATSGARCLEITNNNPLPDLILLDINMPGLSGFLVMEELQASPETAEIPVIFVTGADSIADEEKGLNLGAVDYITKPVNPILLLARVKTHLLVKQAEDILRNKNLSLECKVTENELRLKHVIESIPSTLYQASFPDLKFIFFDAKVEQLIGIAPQQFELGSLNWYENIDQKDRDNIKQQLQQIVQEKQTNFQFEYRITHATTKALVWIEDNGSIEYDSSGNPTTIHGALLNIDLRKETEKNLQAAFESTVKAVSNALEKRDPYTANHQINCAHISKAIAQQMNLGSETINGLYQAAAIHDIGKIYLPSEILNKPSTLTDAELGLIKTHSQVGFDIIKDIKFPWPIAKIILQHHERIDGSGYPNGCTADEICIEAKILGVADFVDASSSDRPYRKGIGIDNALNDLKKYSGILYDPEIVNACLIIFKEKKITFYDKS